MTMWVVVRVSEEMVGTSPHVETFGAWDTRDGAEQARRRIHLARRLEHPEDQWSSFAPRTYVAQIRPESEATS